MAEGRQRLRPGVAMGRDVEQRFHRQQPSGRTRPRLREGVADDARGLVVLARERENRSLRRGGVEGVHAGGYCPRVW